MKQCFKCERSLPLADFYAHPMMADGHLGKCKECTKSDVRQRYVATRPDRAAYERKRAAGPARKLKAVEYQRRRRAMSPEKYAARMAIGNAVRDGRVTRKPCEACGTTDRVQAHHDDYSRPLEVRWLCFKHHREHHGQVVMST